MSSYCSLLINGLTLQNMMSDKLWFGDCNTPVGMKVKTATIPDLPREGDFARFMEVLDAVNKNSDGVNQLENALVKKVLVRI